MVSMTLASFLLIRILRGNPSTNVSRTFARLGTAVVSLAVGFLAHTICPATAQNLPDCIGNAAYQEYCRNVDTGTRCSPQFTEVCCTCQATWGEEFEYCQFTQALFPTPTPSPTSTPIVTPGATPTPTPQVTPGGGGGWSGPPFGGDVNANSIVCDVRLTTICEGTTQRTLIDVTGAKVLVPGPVQYGYRYQCSQYPLPLPFLEDTTGQPISGPTSAGQVNLVLTTLSAPEEYQCNVEVLIEAGSGQNFARRTCKTAVLVNDCSLGCSSDFLIDRFVSLDGLARLQAEITTSVARMWRGVGGKPGDVKKVRLEAADIHARSWGLVWQMQPLVKQCSNTSLCVLEVSAAAAPVLDTDSARQLSLVQRTAKKIRRLTQSQAKLSRLSRMVRRARSQRNAFKRTLEKLPRSSSVCGQ